MKVSRKHCGSWYGSNLLLSLLALVLGCNSSSQPSASGQLQLPTGSQFTFDGDTLELRASANPTQLAFGQLKPDGSFKIESLVDGQVVEGAPPGSYQARVVIADDDYAHKKQATKEIPKKYFNFDTANLIVEVPNQNIQLTLSK